MSISQHTGAFVVQFQTGMDMNSEWFKGRAEHVASGELLHFDSRDELMSFLERVLKQECADLDQLDQTLLGNSHPAFQLPKEK